MAKKAKRRGRPPESKNKKKMGNGKSMTGMEVGQLRAYIGNLEDLLAEKVREQRELLTAQLAELQNYAAPRPQRWGALRCHFRGPVNAQRRSQSTKAKSRRSNVSGGAVDYRAGGSGEGRKARK